MRLIEQYYCVENIDEENKQVETHEFTSEAVPNQFPPLELYDDIELDRMSYDNQSFQPTK